ncbi:MULTISPECIES: hypothetical protein [unclassified Vibrio]|uniref:Uncharacterized protein n=1 Tax=Vibrio sp. HB236076 TaxID=3232307 RepID=A0AB39HBS8_9VIBR|nr:hypothetical protein [Vibrio sp. HB161653]MDP5253558.1 hypothetical protein [Vibrio sp. HB161653]
MTQYILSFPPMLLGAQLLLTLILIKGDLCPGQRGRLHKVLLYLAVLWVLPALTMSYYMFLISAIVLLFCSQVKMKKTRDEGPMWLMHGANVVATALVLWQMWLHGQGGMAGLWLVQLFLLGAALTHVLLVTARSRLQAFHQLLPLVGIISGMGLALVVLLLAYQLDTPSLNQLTQRILVALSLLVTAVIIWAWHLFKKSTVDKIQLWVALLCLIACSGQLVYLLP